jgi:hypothetical protein
MDLNPRRHGFGFRKRRLAPQRLPSLVGEERLFDRVERIVDEHETVLAGPWAGEVGYELLYWIPFLRWLARSFPQLRERLVVCSRGGVESWYADLTSRYVELFELISPPDILRQRRRTPPPKSPDKVSKVVGYKGRDVEEHVMQLLGDRFSDLGHIGPQLMYGLLRRLRRSPRHVYRTLLEPAPIRPPTTTLDLPETFCAVRFYTGGGTPRKRKRRPGVKKTVIEIVKRLGEAMPVVSLDPQVHLDEHVDFNLPGARRIPPLDPAVNLRELTGAIGRASIFVGSYGGFSYIAPYVGVPAIVWLAQHPESPGVGQIHLAMIRRLFASPEFGDYVVLTPNLTSRAHVLEAVASVLGNVPPREP